MPAIVTTDPSDPSAVVGEVESFDQAGAARVIDAATRAARGWSRDSAPARSKVLGAAADAVSDAREELAQLITAEVGKPITESRAEVERACSILRYYAQLCLLSDGETYPPTAGNGFVLAKRYALGTALLITPWNFPVAILVWKMAPALAYGNAVVWKPSSRSVATAELLHSLVSRHLPDGCLSFLPTGSEVGRSLIDDPRLNPISFTGSSENGRWIRSRAVIRGARVQCEMGGINSSIVLSSADLNAAASAIAGAAMGFAGQKCTATRRVIVHRDVYSGFREAILSAVQSLRVGDPRESDVQVGPVISEDARELITQQGAEAA